MDFIKKWDGEIKHIRIDAMFAYPLFKGLPPEIFQAHIANIEW